MGPTGGHHRRALVARVIPGTHRGSDFHCPLHAPRDRQPRRGRHAGHQRRPRAQRGARGADPRHRALHRDRAPRAVRAPGRRAPLPRPRESTGEEGSRGSAYLDYAALERALVETRADAAWVGWGFVAEHPAFAELCERLGIVFVGPDADVMRALGDKIEAKRLAEQAGVPVAPWSGGPVETAEEATPRRGDRLSAHDQGRRRRRRARHAPGGPAGRACAGVRARARGGRPAFGDPRVLMERIVGDARHVEVQLMADGAGRRVGARRARLLLPAPPPEGRRGVGQPGAHGRAGARGRRGRRAARARGRLPRRRHRRVPLRARRAALLLHGGQHAPPGRAPGHRGRHRRRSRQAAAACRGRRQARGRSAAAARACDRGAPERRGPGPRLRARRRAASRCCGCRPGRAYASTAASRRATPCRRSSTR